MESFIGLSIPVSHYFIIYQIAVFYGVLLLEPKHSFTHCFYPGVDCPTFRTTSEDLKELAQKHLYQLRIFNLKTKSLAPVKEETGLNGYANIILIPEERLAEFS